METTVIFFVLMVVGLLTSVQCGLRKDSRYFRLAAAGAWSLIIPACGPASYEEWAPPEAIPTIQAFEAEAGCLRSDLHIEHRTGDASGMWGLSAVHNGKIWLWPDAIADGYYAATLTHELLHQHGHEWHSDDPDSIMAPRMPVRQSGPPEPTSDEWLHAIRYCRDH